MIASTLNSIPNWPLTSIEFTETYNLKVLINCFISTFINYRSIKFKNSFEHQGFDFLYLEN
jgi:hypothetical protein